MIKISNSRLPVFFNKDPEKVLEDLGSSEQGLLESEAGKRLVEFGPNKLPEMKPDNLAVIFFRQFQSPLIFILLLATIIVFITGEKMDGIVILFILFFNAAVGTFQEGRAQNIFLALKNFTKTNASVIRGGKEFIVADEEISRGDVIVLREGEKVPADARLIYSESLQVNEAAITGESSPKFKFINSINKDDIPVSEQRNMVFKGTNIVSGSGRAVITATGADTFIGNIAQKILNIDEELPLKTDIRHFSNFIIKAVLAISVFLFIIGLMFGHDIKGVFSTIVAVAVSIIPEGLPIVVTLVLATGVWRMGKKNVLIKKLQAVEALGQTNVIAVDKTGTVTKNELAVKEIYVDKKSFMVGGIGYDMAGEIQLDGKTIEPLNHPELIFMGKIAALTSSANLAFDSKTGIWKISGDPTEAATLIAAEKIGYSKADLEKEYVKLEERPFDYKLKYHAALHKNKGRKFLTVIGAPEEIFRLSTRIWHPDGSTLAAPEEKERLRKIFLAMSEKGLRVVAAATADLPDENIPDKIKDLEFVGFLGEEDIARLEVKAAVERVKLAGIKLVMITGDHEKTALAIASEAGIFEVGDKILSGEDIEKMSESELAAHLGQVSVFARVTPGHKLKIINAYKISGKTVAMTGDGVNDTLSLTSADVGVAMGKIGTEVAKEAADIILLDDNFGSIVSGIEEGRNIFRTIRRVILYLFSTSLGEVMTIIGAIIMNFPIPILPAQILWLNLVTDGFLDIALAMEPDQHKILSNRIGRKKTGLVDTLMVQRMVLMALPMAIGTLLLFSLYFKTDIQKAWTISLTTLAVFQWFNAWNCRSASKSIFSAGFFANKYLIAATGIVIALQMLAIYNPFFQRVLRTVPLSLNDWMIIIPVSLMIVAVEETRKMFSKDKKIIRQNM